MSTQAANEYRWARRSFPAPPQAVGEFVETVIAERGAGVCKPEWFVEAARDPNSAPHDLLDWEDEVAGPKWRQHQARQIMNSLAVKVVCDDGLAPGDVWKPAFISVARAADDEPPERGYQTYRVVFAHPGTKQEAIDEALALLRGVQRRCLALGALPQLDPVWRAIDAVEAQQRAAANGNGHAAAGAAIVPPEREPVDI